MRVRKLTWMLLSVVVCVTSTMSVAMADDAAARASDLSPVERTHLAIEKALQQPKVWPDFSGKVAGFANHMSDVLGVRVVIDHRALDDIGFDLSQPVRAPKCGEHKLTGRNYLGLVLHSIDLDYDVNNESLVITISEAVEAALRTRVYPVYDLTYLGTRDGQPQFDHKWLLELISSAIQPQSWDEVGGAGAVQHLRHSLVVSQTREIHAEVADLLTALREVKPDQLSLAVGMSDEPFEATLDKRVSLEFKAVTLEEVARLISDQIDVVVTIDRRALDDIGFDFSQKISFECADVTARSALQQILRSLDLELTWKYGTLQITTSETGCGYLVTKLYPVGDLAASSAKGPLDFDSMIAVITGSISPQSWDEVGGAGMLMPIERPACLVVSQTHEVHDQIADLLTILRRQQPTIVKQREAAAAKNLVAPESPIVDHMYSFAQEVEVADVASAIEKFVQPKSWKDDPRVALQKIGNMLVVRHTADVHAEINQFLQQAGVHSLNRGGGIFSIPD